MKLELTFNERFGALLLLAAIGKTNLKTWQVIQAGQGQLKITEADRKKFELNDTDVPGILSWNTKGNTEKQKFDVDEQLVTFLRSKLKVLDEKELMQKELVPLATKLGLE